MCLFKFEIISKYYFNSNWSNYVKVSKYGMIYVTLGFYKFPYECCSQMYNPATQTILSHLLLLYNTLISISLPEHKPVSFFLLNFLTTHSASGGDLVSHNLWPRKNVKTSVLSIAPKAPISLLCRPCYFINSHFLSFPCYIICMYQCEFAKDKFFLKYD